MISKDVGEPRLRMGKGPGEDPEEALKPPGKYAPERRKSSWNRKMIKAK
jgi:hypothetical protein